MHYHLSTRLSTVPTNGRGYLVRIGLISDVHCNVEALDFAVAKLAGEVDEILLAGDALYEYRFSNEVLESIQGNSIRYIIGNHEMVLLGPHGQRARSAPTVRQSNLDFLTSAPSQIRTRVGGKEIMMVHGSPWEPYNQYLCATSPELLRCAELDADVLILGHTHIPMCQRIGRTLVVNPGSLGNSREPGHTGTVSYAVLDTHTDEFAVHRFANPLLSSP